MPRVICNHNSYWLRGVGATPITTFIRLGGSRDDFLKNYTEVTETGVHRCPHVMPYEKQPRHLHRAAAQVPIEQAWPQAKHFE